MWTFFLIDSIAQLILVCLNYIPPDKLTTVSLYINNTILFILFVFSTLDPSEVSKKDKNDEMQ